MALQDRSGRMSTPVQDEGDCPLMGALSTTQTWRVTIAYPNKLVFLTRCHALVESPTPPIYGQHVRACFGLATIVSKRPRRIPAGLTRIEAYAYRRHIVRGAHDERSSHDC